MMNNKKTLPFFLCWLSVFFFNAANALTPLTKPGMPSWAIGYFHGWMTNNNIGPLLVANDVQLRYGQMNTIEVLHSLPAPLGGYLGLLQAIGNNLEAGGNITERNDPNGKIYEGDAYLMLRWTHFPWNRYMTNTFAFGDGLSYVTAVPYREIQDSSNNNPKRLLNFLTVEATFALPSHPDLQLVTRIHHRCGAWGLFGAGNLSSNALSAGIRYWF